MVLEDFIVAVKPTGLLEVMLMPTLFVSRVLIAPFAQVSGRVMDTVRTSSMRTLKVVALLQVVIPSEVVQAAIASCSATSGKNAATDSKQTIARLLRIFVFGVFFLTISSL